MVRILVTSLFSSLLIASAFPQSPSEQEKSRPGKDETIQMMVKSVQLPPQELSAKLEAIMSNESGSTTPRSDFLYCWGLAYLGNNRAQACVGSAFERGQGVVEDATDAYIWYSIALENKVADASGIGAKRARVKERLVHNYPSPTDDELDELVKKQQNEIVQYRAEVKKAK